MASMDNLGQMFNRGINFQALLKGSDMTPQVQAHLVHVYRALAVTVLSATAGVFLYMQTHIGGLFTGIAAVGMLGWLGMDKDKGNASKRVGILAGFGFLKGMSLGSLVEMVLEVDPSILLVAVLSTSVVFACFTGAALVAKRRAYLYLGGTLSSAMGVLALASLAGIFVRSELLFNVNLYLGLIIFCGYIVFDTQLIVEKASYGDRDFAWHAAELFIDLVATFVRICIILLKNSQKREDRRQGTNKPNAGTARR